LEGNTKEPENGSTLLRGEERRGEESFWLIDSKAIEGRRKKREGRVEVMGGGPIL